MAERISNGSARENDDQEESEPEQEAKCSTGNGPLLIVDLERIGSDLHSRFENFGKDLALAHEGDTWFIDRLQEMARLAWQMARLASRVARLLEKEAYDLVVWDEERARNVMDYARKMRKHLDAAMNRLRLCRTWQTLPSEECERRAKYECRILISLAIAGGAEAWLS